MFGIEREGREFGPTDEVLAEDVKPNDTIVIETSRGATRLRCLKPLGEGGLGSVWHAREETPGKKSADRSLKILHSDTPEKASRSALHISRVGESHRQREEVLERTRAKGEQGPIQETFTIESERGLIVSEFVPGNDLDGLIEEPKPNLNYQEIANVVIPASIPIAIEILKVAAWLKKIGIVHRDLDPTNLIHHIRRVGLLRLSTRRRVTAIDLDLATTEEVGNNIRIPAGRMHALDSDIIIGRSGYNHQSDAYAIGMILLQMLCGEHPEVQVDHTHRFIEKRIEEKGAQPYTIKEGESNTWQNMRRESWGIFKFKILNNSSGINQHNAKEFIEVVEGLLKRTRGKRMTVEEALDKLQKLTIPTMTRIKASTRRAS